MAATGPRFFRPAMLLATWFGCGLLPYAPGTWGALAALPLAWFLVWLDGPGLLLIAAGTVFILGCAVGDVAARAAGESDPQWVVIDEVAGQLLTLAVVPPSLLAYLAGFLLFRLFDIWKPFPIRAIERSLSGGFGIMADDAIAALYAGLVLLIGSRLLAG